MQPVQDNSTNLGWIDYAIGAVGALDAAAAVGLWFLAPAEWSTRALALYVGTPAVTSSIAVAMSIWLIVSGLRGRNSTLQQR